MAKRHVVLASASPRRKEILSLTGIKFQQSSAEIDESKRKNEKPAAYAKRLSIEKCKVISNNYSANSLLIAADTIVVLRNSVLGKPGSKKDAVRMLTRLQNKKHKVITAISVFIDHEHLFSFSVTTMVEFGKVSKEEILRYVDSGQPLDKAGAYGIQDEFGASYIKRISGDYYNVVGFPLSRFINEIQNRSHYFQ